MKNDENVIIIKEESGKEHKYFKLFTCNSKTTKKDYIVYTDFSLDKNGNMIVKANTYDPTGEDCKLKPLTEEREWKFINELLKKFSDIAVELGDSNE